MIGAQLTGKLVRLVVPEPKEIARHFARWTHHTEYHRMLDTDPAALWSVKKWTEWMEKDVERTRSEPGVFFVIQTLADALPIGFLAMFGILPQHGDGLVAIGLGEPAYWGKGYGTDAMDLLLNYGFNELGLYRVSLFVFGYNARGIRSYEKNGYRLEGTLRDAQHRDGKRWDIHMMGVLRPEWENAHAARETGYANLEINR